MSNTPHPAEVTQNMLPTNFRKISSLPHTTGTDGEINDLKKKTFNANYISSQTKKPRTLNTTDITFHIFNTVPN